MSEFSITAVLISALISAVVGVVAWGRRPAPGWLGLTILGCSACAWSFSYSLPWLFVTKTLPHVWVLLASVPVFIYQAAVLLLVLEYTRREELNLRRSLLILAIEPAIMLVVVALDPVFGLYVGAHGQGSLLGPVSRGGPAFWAHSVYVLALTAVAITLMGQSLRDPRWLARRQAWTILGAVLLNFLAYVVQLAGLSPLPSLNLVPFTFAVTGLMLVYGLFSLGLLSIIPVARTRLVEEMREGVLVLDEEGTIIDANPAAIRLAGLPAHAIGLSAREVLRATGTNLKKLRDREPVELSVRTDSLRVLEASTSYVVSKAGDTRAQLITLRDVTQQKQLEYNLEAGRRQLEGELELVGRMLDAMSEGVLLMDAAGALVMGDSAVGNGVVELYPLQPDSLEYFQRPLLRRAVTDHTGRWAFEWLPVPGGPWLVRAYADPDRNLRAGEREPQRLLPDTLSLAEGTGERQVGALTLYAWDAPGRLHMATFEPRGWVGAWYAWPMDIAAADTGSTPAPAARGTKCLALDPAAGSTLETVPSGALRVVVFADIDGDSLLSRVPTDTLRLKGAALGLPDSLAAPMYLEPWWLVENVTLPPGLDANLALPGGPPTLTAVAADDTTGAAARNGKPAARPVPKERR